MLEGKAALVTGGAQGIGREIALRFAREGRISPCSTGTPMRSRRRALDAEALGRRAVALAVDISRRTRPGGGENKIVDSMKRIDILVNNAGITRDTFILRMAEADWDAVIAVNLKGAFNVTRAVARTMLRQRAGRIINIASIIGLIGNAGQANYAASKAGLIGFTKSVAKELASRGITVNAVAPGFIETRMTGVLPDEIKGRMQAMIPLGRFGAPADVAGAALFLASDLASYITGQTIVVDGGMVM